MLGYFVLAVDAFGAGERAIEPAPGTYHGALLGASTWPAGTPLLGLQIYDNMRAVDYMISRPEVDPDRLAITGASGGGNQSMNAGAWDERFKVVVPVCSVGTYVSYLGAACCICEVLPGGLTIAEEGEILAMVAPRALLVINATRDAHQFSVAEAAKSVERARPVFELHGAADKLRHVIIDSAHDYNQSMREALYGWLARWLRDDGDGSPVAEPELTIEPPDALRCFPDNVRPKTFTLMPSFVFGEANARIDRLPKPDHRERWEADALVMRDRLERRVFGGFPRTTPWKVQSLGQSREPMTSSETIVLYPEPELPLPARFVRGSARTGVLPTAIVLDPAGKEVALESPAAQGLIESGWQVMSFDLRATGETAVSGDAIREAVDHNSVEWSIWIGRPLLGQWCWDILCMLDYLHTRPDVDVRHLALVGSGAAALASICAAGLDDRARSVAAFGLLNSYASPQPFQGHRMATLVPFMLDVGDVPHLAGLVAPRRLIVSAPLDAQSRPLNEESLEPAFQFTRQSFRWYNVPGQFLLTAELAEHLLPEALRGGS
jgi:dienelactone hydrolase